MGGGRGERGGEGREGGGWKGICGEDIAEEDIKVGMDRGDLHTRVAGYGGLLAYRICKRCQAGELASLLNSNKFMEILETLWSLLASNPLFLHNCKNCLVNLANKQV